MQDAPTGKGKQGICEYACLLPRYVQSCDGDAHIVCPHSMWHLQMSVCLIKMHPQARESRGIAGMLESLKSIEHATRLDESNVRIEICWTGKGLVEFSPSPGFSEHSQTDHRSTSAQELRVYLTHGSGRWHSSVPGNHARV